MYQAALQASSSGDGWSQSLAWDCSASPRNYNYKRYYQPGTGRYLARDADLYAGYVYASNNPSIGYDPYGLLTIIVHGTYAENAKWAQPGSPFNQAVSETFHEDAVAFSWCGGNSLIARMDAALRLVKFIRQHLRPGEKLNIVAHSHGGNVVKMATLFASDIDLTNFVELGTPQRPDYRLRPGSVRRHYNVFFLNDDIQTQGGNGWIDLAAFEAGPAGRQAKFPAINVEINELGSGLQIGHSDLHEEFVWKHFVQYAADIGYGFE
ncbi:MAG: hypothetical protein D6712_07980 [Chloroflexi bacterium]|nr:MAG: hypothetical protein D6712_07980 [Chloroflexota bacterium]